MSDTNPSTSSPSQSLDRLAAQLAALGSETPGERKVKFIVPWVISITFHLGLILIAVFVTWTVANRPAKDESILIVADFNALNYEPLAALSQNETPDEPKPAVQDLAPSLPQPSDLLTALAKGERDPSALLSQYGAPAGDTAALSAFAPASDGHAVSFAGTSASNARRIVYAIDATGTMIAHFQIVIDELARSLSNLSSQQSFSVIFFQGSLAIEVPPVGRLKPATADERDRALNWIKTNIVPRSGTDPLVAIEKAVRLKPDVIFLLSHGITGYGKFEIDQSELLKQLDKLNPIRLDNGRRAVQINCIQFIDPDPLDTMKTIAQNHGGANGYKFLSREELRLTAP